MLERTAPAVKGPPPFTRTHTHSILFICSSRPPRLQDADKISHKPLIRSLLPKRRRDTITQ
jgi:hypothetical protein